MTVMVFLWNKYTIYREKRLGTYAFFLKKGL